MQVFSITCAAANDGGMAVRPGFVTGCRRAVCCAVQGCKVAYPSRAFGAFVAALFFALALWVVAVLACDLAVVADLF